MTSSPKKKQFCSCGASGCVIYPGRQCSKTPCKSSMCNTPKATKIFYNKEFYENEKSIFDKNNNKLKRLDPNEDFFLSSYEDCGSIDSNEIDTIQKKYENCDLNNTDNKQGKEYSFNIHKLNPGNIQDQPKPDINDLDWLKYLDEESVEDEDVGLDKPRQLETINFTFLGTDLKKKLKLIKKDNFYETILVPFENLFRAIHLLNENNIYHCDIKPDNIVFDERTGTFKLIDFGLAIFDHISNTDSISEGMTTGFISPEFYYRKLRQYIGYGFIEDRSEFKKNDDETEITFTPNEYVYVFNKFEKKNENETEKIQTSYYKTLFETNNPLIYSKNDIWALGCVLKYIINVIVDLFNKESKTSTEKEINYFKIIITKLNEVIKKILILDVEKRPDTMDALALYTDFLRNTNSGIMSLPRGRPIFRTARTRRIYSSRSKSSRRPSSRRPNSSSKSSSSKSSKSSSSKSKKTKKKTKKK